MGVIKGSSKGSVNMLARKSSNELARPFKASLKASSASVS
jgi:hypothetical protein